MKMKYPNIHKKFAGSKLYSCIHFSAAWCKQNV